MRGFEHRNSCQVQNLALCWLCVVGRPLFVRIRLHLKAKVSVPETESAGKWKGGAPFLTERDVEDAGGGDDSPRFVITDIAVAARTFEDENPCSARASTSWIRSSWVRTVQSQLQLSCSFTQQ